MGPEKRSFSGLFVCYNIGMSSFRPWAMWRRVQYGIGFGAFWGLIGVLIFFVWFYEAANCFDGVMNGTETGVDCGGACVQICTADTIPPRVVWAESFEITSGQYNAVAYVENRNVAAGVPELPYRFEFLSESGAVIAEQSGVTVLPPDSVYPVFEGRVFTNEPVAETRLVLGDAPYFVPGVASAEQFNTFDRELSGSDSRPQLRVEIENTALQDAENVEVVATIYNGGTEPATASQTFVENIPARSREPLVFTWPNPIAKAVRSCIIPTDVAMGIDLSGSMNNDGGTPPQPVTDALAAASDFAERLQEDDQVAVVTFATEAVLQNELTQDITTTAALINDLSIGAEAERGYTNTMAALRLAQAELDSTRHNPDARRVLVLLTDGLPTAPGRPDVSGEAVAIAKELNESGIEIYTIGLGSDVNETFIREVASEESNAFLAPSRSDLDAIYSEITTSLCETGPTKIDVIAKTPTVFESLR